MARLNIRPVLLGPDTKHGAKTWIKVGSYRWYAVWYERGQRRLRSLDRERGEDYSQRFNEVCREIEAEGEPQVKALTQRTVGDIIVAYHAARVGVVIDPQHLTRTCKSLSAFFGTTPLDGITDELCQQYALRRPSSGTARLELGFLQTAINYAAKASRTAIQVAVWRPGEPPPKDIVIPRGDLARIVRRFARNPRSRHYAVATLICYHTAARPGSVLALEFRVSPSGGHVDMTRKMITLNPHGRAATRKVKPTIPIPNKLLAIMRARSRRGGAVCAAATKTNLNLKDFEKAWRNAIKALGLPKSTPHSLRHTRITELVSSGAPVAKVAAFAGLTIYTLMKKYAHLVPNHLSDIADFRPERD
jgi:integrase